jgi:hypothetical protein
MGHGPEPGQGANCLLRVHDGGKRERRGIYHSFLGNAPRRRVTSDKNLALRAELTRWRSHPQGTRLGDLLWYPVRCDIALA